MPEFVGYAYKLWPSAFDKNNELRSLFLARAQHSLLQGSRNIRFPVTEREREDLVLILYESAAKPLDSYTKL